MTKREIERRRRIAWGTGRKVKARQRKARRRQKDAATPEGRRRAAERIAELTRRILAQGD